MKYNKVILAHNKIKDIVNCEFYNNTILHRTMTKNTSSHLCRLFFEIIYEQRWEAIEETRAGNYVTTRPCSCL